LTEKELTTTTTSFPRDTKARERLQLWPRSFKSCQIHRPDWLHSLSSLLLALGFVLKGIRKQVFVPLIEEVQALHGVVKVKELTINRMIEFVRSLGIQAEVRNLIEGIVVDPIVGRYRVLVNEKGRVLDTNVCIEAEIVLLIRQQGNVYIYSRRW